MLRAKWFLTGVPVGFWWGWKKSNEWELEAMVGSVLPGPVAKHVVDLLPKKGSADVRHKLRLEETVRKQEDALRKQEDALRRMEATTMKQEQTIGLLHAVLARLPPDGGHQRPPTTTPALPPPPPKQ